MKLRVFYDGKCPFCTASARTLQKLDWFDRLNLQDFHRENVLEGTKISLDQASQRMQVIDEQGKVSGGIHAVYEICKQLPVLWLLIPPVWLSIQIGLGQKFYDWIARNRFLFPMPDICGLDPDQPDAECK